MGCTQSYNQNGSGTEIPGGNAEERQLNDAIEEELRKELELDQSQIKLLLLGAGDSGKTTLRKQMRNVFGSGFTYEMRFEFTTLIVGILLGGFVDVLTAMKDMFKMKLTTVEGEDAADAIIESASKIGKLELTESLAKDMKTLLADPIFHTAVSRRSEFQLQDCWSVFAEEVKAYPTWGGPDWLPSVEDCIACRVRTSGIQEEPFTLDGVSFRVFDVGGQRAERRKWIHCFDNVTAIIFVAAISEYDQNLYEDRKKNRLEEAVELFDDVCNNPIFENIDMILFLNKRDLFEKKFVTEGTPIDAKRFPGAPQAGDVTVALQFFERLFVSKNRFKKKIHVHVTTATDPGNIKKVFDACKNIILRHAMEASGFRD